MTATTADTDRLAAALDQLLDLLRAGAPIRLAARRIGFTVGFLYRLRTRDAGFGRRWTEAVEAGQVVRARRHRRPKVRWSRTCPGCRADGSVKVRRNRGGLPFWYCSARCGWACWRPPALDPCPGCGGTTYWSCSRLSVGCPACGWRARVDRVPH